MELIYGVMGLIVARLLERKKMQVAVIAHAVLFIVISFFLLLIPESGYIADFARLIFTEKGYGSLRYALVEDALCLEPAMNLLGLAEIIVVLLSLVIVMAVIAGEGAGDRAESGTTVFPRNEAVPEDKPVYGKIYLKYCRLLN